VCGGRFVNCKHIFVNKSKKKNETDCALFLDPSMCLGYALALGAVGALVSFSSFIFYQLLPHTHIHIHSPPWVGGTRVRAGGKAAKCGRGPDRGARVCQTAETLAVAVVLGLGGRSSCVRGGTLGFVGVGRGACKSATCYRAVRVASRGGGGGWIISY